MAIVKSKPNKKSRRPTTTEMEIAVAHLFTPRVNLCIPNVSWGLGLSHECDLFVLTQSGYGYEVEIKISRSDLKRDLEKSHNHYSSKIKKLYFAIPEHLLRCKDMIPNRAGIIVVRNRGWNDIHGSPFVARRERDAETNSSYQFTDSERYQIARLGALRVFPLKRTIVGLSEKLNAITSPNTPLCNIGNVT